MIVTCPDDQFSIEPCRAFYIEEELMILALLKLGREIVFNV